VSRQHPRPETQQEPVVARVRIRYAKRGRLRFTSHRDFARALERAVRRAGVPIAYSSGFSPHPKISYASAAPTGVASEAEYLELGLRAPMDPASLRAALDAALPPGLDILEAVPAHGSDFADRFTASRWRIELPGVPVARAAEAVAGFLAATEVPVERMTKSGRRTLDARSPVVTFRTTDSEGEPAPYGPGVGNATPGPTAGPRSAPCAILDLVVRHVTPSVRPDDVLTGLHAVAALELPEPPRVTRMVQGYLVREGSAQEDQATADQRSGGRDEIVDPLAADRERAVTGTPSQ
jgi:radical SAM-linked protein